MEFSSFVFYLLSLSQIFQLSNTIVSSTKVEIPAQDGPTDKLDSLTGQIPNYDSFARTFNNSHPTDVDIGKRLVRQRIKRDTDVVYIDHRQSGCIGRPKNQLGCEASYAFATIAFYEWLLCQTSGRYKPFSEQYIIDCSFGHGNDGCNGGNPGRTMMFINDDLRGLVLQSRYPYTGIQGRCPNDNSPPSGNMDSRVMFIPLDQLEEYIAYGPIILMVEIRTRLISYTGGVDDNVGYTPQFLHAMLLIGHGRENGKDYWLFRNSLFGYGGDGIYKLNKNVDCFSGGAGIGLRGRLTLE